MKDNNTTEFLNEGIGKRLGGRFPVMAFSSSSPIFANKSRWPVPFFLLFSSSGKVEDGNEERKGRGGGKFGRADK